MLELISDRYTNTKPVKDVNRLPELICNKYNNTKPELIFSKYAVVTDWLS